jgi:hypothetical protein
VDRLRLRLIRPNTRSRKHTPDMILSGRSGVIRINSAILPLKAPD